MDIAAVSSALSAVGSYAPSQIGSVAQAVSVEMLDQAMNMNEAMNAQLISLMEQSVNPHLGGSIDLRI